MTITMYDLAGAEADRRFSPFCWRAKMALRHKNLSVDTVPWRFTEKDAIGFTEQGRVPIIIDQENDGKAVWDSWEIAKYLDATYPENPLIPEGAASETLFIKYWVETAVHPAIVKVILLDVFHHLDEKDQDYFRTSREKLFGRTLEEIGAEADAMIAPFQKVLHPARLTLKVHPFLGGDAPTMADYILFGVFGWARAISEKQLLVSDDPVYAWRQRMLDLNDGYAAAAPGYPV